MEEFEIIPRTTYAAGSWVFFSCLALLAFVTLIKQLYPSYLSKVAQSAVNMNLASQQFRDEELSPPVASILLSVLYFLSVGLSVYLIVWHFKVNVFVMGWRLFVLLLLAIFILSLLHRNLHLLSASLLKVKDAVSWYLFNSKTVNHVIGILLLPFILLLAYGNSNVQKITVVIIIIIFAIKYLFILFKGLLGSFKLVRQYFMHFILYICTLEILPILVVAKFIQIQLAV